MADLQKLHAFSEPTYCRLKHCKDTALLARLNDLENVMTVLKSSQKQQDKIMSEAKLLQIMIYKRRQQLRSEKSLQLLRRVQACLKRASTFGRLFTLIDDIHKDLLSAMAEMKKNDVYLPAQQTWTYLLYLQLQYQKLLDVTASYCITTFKHLSCQFATGMLIPQMVVFMSIVARIWMLSGTLAEKIQNCYSLVYSLRQHIDRTNSAWKEPVLPPKLQQSSHDDDCGHLQKMSSIASKVPVNDSREIAEAESLGKVHKNTVMALDEEMEDIGVPVALTRTNNLGLSDNRSNKRKKIGESDFTPSKKRKHVNDSSKQDDVTEGTSKSSLCFIQAELPAAKKKKKKKRQQETTGMEMKKACYVPKRGHHEETIHTQASDVLQNALAFDVRPKKQKKHKRNKNKAISDGHLKHDTTSDGKRTADSPNKSSAKTRYQTTEREDNIKKTDAEVKSHKRKKLKKSKLKKKK